VRRDVVRNERRSRTCPSPCTRSYQRPWMVGIDPFQGLFKSDEWYRKKRSASLRPLACSSVWFQGHDSSRKVPGFIVLFRQRDRLRQKMAHRPWLIRRADCTPTICGDRRIEPCPLFLHRLAGHGSSRVMSINQGSVKLWAMKPWIENRLRVQQDCSWLFLKGEWAESRKVLLDMGSRSMDFSCTDDVRTGWA